MYVWGQDVLEFVATGTAVKALGGEGAHRAPDGRAFTSDLSAQDFFRLLAAGAVPVAFVLGTCVYHIAHQSVMQALRQSGRNQEMIQFTQGVYEARELALVRMQAEASGGPRVRHRRRERGGLQPRLGRARDRVPGHRDGDPAARRRAPAARHDPQAHVHAGPGHLSFMRSVCVFCGSNPGRRPEYLAGAADLGRTLASRGIQVVYGGAHVGVMGALADAALAAGGEVIGVIPGLLVDAEVAHSGLTELRVTGSMHERKATMAGLADGFIALPGGLGTLEEFAEIVTWAQLGLHAKPTGLLNLLGYYDGLRGSWITPRRSASSAPITGR